MTAQPVERTLPSPFRGILPFRYVDQPHFFGREKAVGSLLAKILLYRVVVFFGESGAGKSSVVNAGLIPRLEAEGLRSEILRVRPIPDEPILVKRVPVGDGDEGLFLPSIFAEEGLLQRSSLGPVVTCSVERFLQKTYAWATNARPVLIFDQFEELFTLFDEAGRGGPTSRTLQQTVLDALIRIINDHTLTAKVVFGIRE